MCLLSQKNCSLKKITATEDFVCYKVVKSNMCSMYFDFPYEIGKTYKLETEIKIISPYIGEYNYITEGFHSYVHLQDAKYPHYYNAHILKCIIPKGSIFYVGHSMRNAKEFCLNYVSDTIKIVEIVEG